MNINIANISEYGITLSQGATDDFTVTYGNESRDGMTYREAAAELGNCIFHALACEGRLDISEGE